MALLLRSLEAIPQEMRGGAIAVGNFDGVHRGHRVLIQQLKKLATEVAGPSIVFTFDPPPAALLFPGSNPPPLTTIQRRAELLHSAGVDVVVACPTTRDLLQLEPEEFFQQILLEKLGGKAMVEGPNFRFGKDRRGDTQLLESLCREKNCRFSMVIAESQNGEWISSSRIRQLLGEGKVVEANELLANNYRLDGLVGRGAGRGNKIGFPTANLEPLWVLAPAHGVYAGLANRQGKTYAAAIHVGPNPTFGESHSKVEVHLLGFDQDIYGEFLSVELLERIRGVRKFGSVDELKRQLTLDCQQACETAAK